MYGTRIRKLWNLYTVCTGPTLTCGENPENGALRAGTTTDFVFQSSVDFADSENTKHLGSITSS